MEKGIFYEIIRIPKLFCKTFNPFMHNVWSFYNIIHERVRQNAVIPSVKPFKTIAPIM